MLDDETSGSIVGLSVCWIVFVVTLFTILLNSCTVNLQNVSSNGKATDQVDDTQDAKADVSPNFSIPGVL